MDAYRAPSQAPQTIERLEQIACLVLDPPTAGDSSWREETMAAEGLCVKDATFIVAFLDVISQQALSKISDAFDIPAFIRDKPCEEASGYYWSGGKHLADDKLGSHTTSFRFLIKHAYRQTYVLPRSPAEMADLYYWEKLKFTTNWRKSGTQVLLCWNVGERMQKRIRDSLTTNTTNMSVGSFFSPHAFVMARIVESFDEAVWGWRDLVRKSEQERSGKGLSPEKRSVEMHEIARHLIHCSEMLTTAIDVVQRIKGEATIVPLDTNVANNLIVQKELDLYVSLLVGFFNRSKALEGRMQNEISLVFHTNSRVDSAVSAQIAEATKRDSEAMKTLSILGVVFLPGTFVSSIFGMSFFDFSPEQGTQPERIVVSKMFWIYWAIALPLTVLTIFTWRWWRVLETRLEVKRGSMELRELNL